MNGAFHTPRIDPGVQLNGSVIDWPGLAVRAPRPLADYLAEMPCGGKWGDRKVVRQEGDVVLLERKDVDFVVALDYPDDLSRQHRRYFNFPTKNRTRQEARAAAEREFDRRTS